MGSLTRRLRRPDVPEKRLRREQGPQPQVGKVPVDWSKVDVSAAFAKALSGIEVPTERQTLGAEESAEVRRMLIELERQTGQPIAEADVERAFGISLAPEAT